VQQVEYRLLRLKRRVGQRLLQCDDTLGEPLPSRCERAGESADGSGLIPSGRRDFHDYWVRPELDAEEVR
jgi:hypothetical protein